MKENKAISKLFDVLEWIVTSVLLLLIILVGVQKFSEAGNFFGYRIYIVASGSMIPTYNIGDTLLVKAVPMEEFEIGDAITYKGETAGVDGLVITHQVEKIEKDEKGQYLFHTKGIANNIEDPMVYEKQVLGKVTYKFFILSLLGIVITNRLLLLLGIMLPMAFLVAIEIIKLVYRKDEDEFDELLDVENEKVKEEKKDLKEKKKEIKIEKKEIKEEKKEEIKKEEPVEEKQKSTADDESLSLTARIEAIVKERLTKELEARENKKEAKKPASNKKKYYQKYSQKNKQNNTQKNTQNSTQTKKQSNNQKKKYTNYKKK